MANVDEFGMNGKHEPIGARYTDNQFKGRVLEFIRGHEKQHETDAKVKEKQDDRINFNEKTLWAASGAFALILYLINLKGGI